MASRPKHGGRRGVLLAAAATAVLAVLGIALVIQGLTSSSGGPKTASDTTTSASEAAAPRDAAAPASSRDEASKQPAGRHSPGFENFLPGSPPVGLSIPSIDVRSTKIVDLGLQDDGSIEVPRDASAPGWFTPGPSPGQLGPAVIAGHVDSTTGPAVFYRLGQLRPRDRVAVSRADGSVATFSIDRVLTFEKDEFPTRAVYGPTTRAELRLITCSGNYDDDTGYDSNTVVFAHLV
jgi:sortase (surface protein transpeptidase)